MKPLKKIGIYVDGQSLFRAAWALGPKYGLEQAKPDYEAVMCELIEGVCDLLSVEEISIETATVYSVGRHSSRNFTAALERAGFDVKMHVLRKRGTCRACGTQNDRFSWRTEIVTDAISYALLSSSLDAVVLVVSSPEFLCLAQRLEACGVKVLTVGFAGKTSEKLPNVRYLTERCLYGEPVSDQEVVP